MNEPKVGDFVRILLVEDEPIFAELVARHLKSTCPFRAYRLDHVDSLRKGLASALQGNCDVVLLDLNLPDSRGLATLDAARAAFGQTPIIVLTNQPEPLLGVESIARGAYDFLLKTEVRGNQIWRAIRFALERTRQKRRLDAMLRGVADGIAVVDGARTILYANRAAAEFFRRSPETVVGSRFPLPLDGRRREYTLRGHGGRERVLLLRVGPVDWDAPDPRLVTMHDITEIRDLETTRAEIRSRKSQEEMKDVFLGNLFHEMRSPLTVARSVLHILYTNEDNGLDGKSRELVGVGLRNMERMIRTVCDLLDLSRLESGRAQPRRQRFSMREAVLEAIDDARHFGFPDLEFEVESPAAFGPCDVLADRDMTMQLLHNLIGNATRFARRLVRIAIRANDARVAVDVIDDGPGILTSDLADIFDRYHQALRKGTGPYKGTGLGLPICRDLVVVTGGEIEAGNDSQGGGRVSFSFPAARRAVAEVRGVETSAQRGKL